MTFHGRFFQIIHRFNWCKILWTTWHNCEAPYVLPGKNELHGVLREYSDVLVPWCKGCWVVQLAYFIDFEMLGNLFFNLFPKNMLWYEELYMFSFGLKFSCVLHRLSNTHTHTSMALWASFSTASTVSHPNFDSVVEESFNNEPL